MVSDTSRPSQRSLSDPAGTIHGRSQAIVSLARSPQSPAACRDTKNQTGAPAMVSRLHLCLTRLLRFVQSTLKSQLSGRKALSAETFFGSS